MYLRHAPASTLVFLLLMTARGKLQFKGSSLNSTKAETRIGSVAQEKTGVREY